MVVADDEFNPLLSGIFDLVHRLDSAIQRNNQGKTLLGCMVYPFQGNPVSLFVPIGYVIINGFEMVFEE